MVRCPALLLEPASTHGVSPFFTYQTYRSRVGALGTRLSYKAQFSFQKAVILTLQQSIFRSAMDWEEKQLVCYGASDTSSCNFHSQGTEGIPQIRKF